MVDILGYDCNGNPLRAGDRVEIVVDPTNVLAEGQVRRGDITTVVGPHELGDGRVLIDIPYPTRHYHYWSAQPDCLRKIDQPGQGDWSEIEKVTGWKPRIEVEA